MSERLRLLRMLAARGALKLRAGLVGPVSGLRRLRASPPERLLIAPQDIRTGDPTIAADIYAGYYNFGGKIVNAHGQSPFSLQPPSAEWARQLYGFGWLRHMRAADTALARANARALVKEFIASLGRPAGHIAWAPPVAARRVLAWLSQSPMLLEGVDYDEYRRFIRVLSRSYWLLRREAAHGASAETRLLAAIAVTSIALCAQGGSPSLKNAVALLNGQLALQILPDGGPIGRNPQFLVDVLFDLLPLRQAFSARGLPPPPELLNAIDRIMPALRMFRHGDGSLGLFNGMAVTAPDSVAILLAYEDLRGQAIVNAPYSGYQRLEAGDAIVLLDAGPPPPPLFSRGAHAGCLSFEYSRGHDRIVVNCGSPGASRPDLRASARLTAAHSTLAVNESSSCIFGPPPGGGWFAGEILSGPTLVPVSREESATGMSVVASHDGYLRRFGVEHERRLTLDARGGLRGRDRLVADTDADLAGLNYDLRFHIHPAVTLERIWDGHGVLLRPPGGAALIFEAGGLPLAVEESIFFAAPGGPRPAEQIVVSATAADLAEIDWSFAPQA